LLFFNTARIAHIPISITIDSRTQIVIERALVLLITVFAIVVEFVAH
jgi:hypothetical protein